MNEEDSKNRRPRPVLGPALTVFAALLWAYAVIGTFTTSWISGSAPLGEGVAVLLVAATAGAALAQAVRRSRSIPANGTGGLIGRAVAVGLLAIVMWGLVVILAIVFASAIPANVDAVVMTSFLVIAAMAARTGHRMTGAAPAARLRTMSFPVFALWLGVAAATLVACAEIVGER
jgi:hypothetical protein